MSYPEINGMNLADVTEALNLANTNGRDGSFLKPEYRADFVARVTALEERRRRLVWTENRINGVMAMEQPTVREINDHLASLTSYCYVRRADGSCFRISRARRRRGVFEGRVINGSAKVWEVIPADASVELS